MPQTAKLAAGFAMAAIGILLVGTVPAHAIPSPDLAISLVSNAAQVLGLVSAALGGLLLGEHKMAADRRAGAASPILRRAFRVAMALLLIALAANYLQWSSHQDDKLRRLQANLVRSSEENGQKVGDVNLKELSFSEQIKRPDGLGTDAFAEMLAAKQRGELPGVNLIDIREPEEREAAKLEGLQHARYPDVPLLKGELQLAGNQNVLFCYSGNRSSESCDVLRAQGIDCRFVIGGYEKWKAEGRPVSLTTGRKTGARSLPDFPNRQTLLDTPEVQQMVANEGTVFVDVRYPGDFAIAHLPNAINLSIRPMPTPQMNEALRSLPKSPIIAACYDKRSCFYSEILGLRLHRLGYDFRGRYTVPHEYVPPGKAPGAGDGGLFAAASGALGKMLAWLVTATGSLWTAIAASVAGLRLAFVAFGLKAERDQIVRARILPEIEAARVRHRNDPRRLSRNLVEINRKHNIRPALNLAGACLQIPLFLAFFIAVGAAARTSAESFLWIPSLGRPDPLLLLPAMLGLIVFGHLHTSAARRTRVLTALRAGAGLGIAMVTFSLPAAQNVYLTLSVVLMLGQHWVARGWLARQARASAAGRGLVTAPVAPLDSAHRVPGAGNKASRLGAMLSAGLPVPQGFAISTSAFTADGGLTREASRMIARFAKDFAATRMAVRSSGVNEDGAGRSYAGVFESILNVPAVNLLESILEVRASMATERTRAYAGADEAGGIVVQRMVDASYAGVLFTEHPASTGKLMVEMVSGLGEGLVSGERQPDTYEFGRVTHRPLGESGPPIDLGPLLALGRRIETLFDGLPQDIEWAWADGRFHILQARDITASVRTTGAPDRTAFETERDRLLRLLQDARGDEPVLVQNEITELLPRPSRASLSLMEAIWDEDCAVDKACCRLGMPYDASSGQPYIVTAFGQLCVNRTEAKRRFGAPGALASFRLGRAAESIEQAFRDIFLPEFQGRMRLYRALDLGRLTEPELFDFFSRICADFVGQDYVEAQVVNITADQYFRIAERALVRKNLDPYRYLGAAAETPVTRALALLPEIRAGRRNIEDFITAFGHRAAVDYELAEPRYAENPASVMALVASAVPNRRGGGELPALPESKALALAVDRARRFQVLKEEAKHALLAEFATLRRLLLEIGIRTGLHEAIFHLSLEEVAKLAVSTSREHLAAVAAAHAAQAPRLARVALPGIELTAGMLETLEPEGGADAAVANEELAGTLVAGDLPVEGRAVILRDDDEVLAGEGDIIVVRHLHPRWVPHLPRVSAVVTEVGGWLSHAAILAREYGVPTIVGVRGAMQVIEHGETIRLHPDGSIERLGKVATVSGVDARGVGLHATEPRDPQHPLTHPGEPVVAVDAMFSDPHQSGKFSPSQGESKKAA